MAAPLPDGDSLQAIPQAPGGLNLAAFTQRPIGDLSDLSAGIDYGRQFVRLGQLKDQLALEDLQRKADAAKAKAMTAEADLMHQNLATSYQAKNIADQNAVLQGQIGNTQLGALRDVTVGPTGTAAVDANTAATASGTNNYLAKAYQGMITGALNSGQPVSPASAALGVTNAQPAIPVVPSNDAFYEPNSGISLDDYRGAVAKQLVVRKALNKETPSVTPEEIDKAAGITTQSKTFKGADNRTYSVDVTYGPGGVRLARSTPVPTDISPERSQDLQRAPELADTNQALQATQKAIDAVTAYKAANAGGPIQSLAEAFANTPQTGALSSLKRNAGQSLASEATRQTAAQLDALRDVFGSSQRSTELKAFANSVPGGADLSQPDAVLTKLNTLKSALLTRAQGLSSTTASTAITNKTGNPASVSNGEIRVNASTGVRYKFDAASNQWIPQL